MKGVSPVGYLWIKNTYSAFFNKNSITCSMFILIFFNSLSNPFHYWHCHTVAHCFVSWTIGRFIFLSPTPR